MGTLIVNQYLSKLWTPAEITTSLWFDATKSVTVVDGRVSEWGGVVSNSAIQTTVSNRPTYNATGFNNKPTLNFGASNSHDWLPLSSVVPMGTEENIFIVMDTTNAGSQQYQGLIGRNSSDPVDTPMPYLVNNKIGLYWEGVFVISSQFGYASYEKFIYYGRFKESGATDEVELGKNGSSTITSTSKNFASNPVWSEIGTPVNSQRLLDVNISEIVVTPPTTDREKIEGYLAHKWGLTANLPVTHPYKNNPPYV